MRDRAARLAQREDLEMRSQIILADVSKEDALALVAGLCKWFNDSSFTYDENRNVRVTEGMIPRTLQVHRMTTWAQAFCAGLAAGRIP
jgi:hypothetical protein